MARALLSVANKTGIAEIARTLQNTGLEIVSTGGTMRALRDANIVATPVEEITRYPEMLDGRLKTLHPVIHGGILYRRDLVNHVQQVDEYGIKPIDVVIVNLYPFEESISRSSTSDADALENIDIGGPAMIRAAAKNHEHVLVIVDPDDYESIGAAIATDGMDGISRDRRRELAARAFSHTASYDSLVAGYLQSDPLPAELPIGGRRISSLRYGENPHQSAAVYRYPGPVGLTGIGSWTVVAGGDLSYNNYLDATAAWSTVNEFDDPAAVIVKHDSPCGVAVDRDVVPAFERALAGDPVSAFGGVIALNRMVTEEIAAVIARRKYDVLLAPGYAQAAKEFLESRKGLRLIDTSAVTGTPASDYKFLPGGFLAQSTDTSKTDPASWKSVTERQPTEEELLQLAFAWSVVKHVKSNAIVLARDRGTVGICGGQPNRVDSVRMAVQRAGARSKSSVLASDAFFPFADGVEEAVRAGVTAIAQPGGSMRDAETIAAANEAGAAMVFTGIRHFRH